MPEYDLTKWVCENHPDREWSPITDCPVPGCGGAGMPAPRDKLVPERVAKDEYLILLDGQMVGSIHRVSRAALEPWRWSLDSRYGDARGWAATLDDAKAAFRKAWDETRLKGIGI